MSSKKRTTLARMSDGEWYVCHDSTSTALSALHRAGLIRCADDRLPLIEREWMITAKGNKALEDTE
jgi:hypothetical protein